MFMRKKDLVTMLSVLPQDIEELVSSDGFPKPIYALMKYRESNDMEMYEIKAVNEWLLGRRRTVSAESREEILDMPVTSLGLSARARKVLSRMNVTTVGELTKKTEMDMREVRNCGVSTIKEIKDKVSSLGLGEVFGERAVR